MALIVAARLSFVLRDFIGRMKAIEMARPVERKAAGTAKPAKQPRAG
jgi:hypothetical protein